MNTTIGDLIDKQSEKAFNELKKLESLINKCKSIKSNDFTLFSKKDRIRLWKVKKEINPIIDADYFITIGMQVDGILKNYYSLNSDFLKNKSEKILKDFGGN